MHRMAGRQRCPCHQMQNLSSACQPNARSHLHTSIRQFKMSAIPSTQRMAPGARARCADNLSSILPTDSTGTQVIHPPLTTAGGARCQYLQAEVVERDLLPIASGFRRSSCVAVRRKPCQVVRTCRVADTKSIEPQSRSESPGVMPWFPRGFGVLYSASVSHLCKEGVHVQDAGVRWLQRRSRRRQTPHQRRTEQCRHD